MNIQLASASDAAELFEVWERSVRATHLFLSEENIEELIPLVRKLLAEFTPIHCTRDDRGAITAFLGCAGDSLEMLFVHPAYRGTGIGSTLLKYAIDVLCVSRVDVNEQNPQAVGFYLHKGFVQTSRSDCDGFGHPYPILQLTLSR
jgi:putative acetyltransferase